MADLCTDGRFELIKKYRQELIDSTNIEMSQDEMAVIDSILFRFWQMGWLDRLEQPERKKGKWIRETKHHEDSEEEFYYYEERCSECGARRKIGWSEARYCPNCGARMEE